METKKKLFERINEKVNMVDLLFKLGYKGVKHGRNYFFNSPLREERTPSFSVHETDNVWKDFGTGEGGNIIDFGEQKYGSVSNFIKLLLDHYPNLYENDQPTIQRELQEESKEKSPKEEPEIKILRVRTLFSYPLLKYLEERRINRAIADQYCREVHYQLRDKTYFAIGFKNDSGGYALRNRYVKQALAPNDLTFIDNGAKECASFEGSFDFLSYKTLYHNQGEPKRNYLILNSTSFFEKALPILQRHEKNFGYWDNDKTGDKCTKIAQELLGESFSDERGLFKQYKDLNEFHQSFGLHQKNKLNQRL